MSTTNNSATKRNKLSRESIINEAAHIIAERGLPQLTMRSLAKRLDCSIGTLPHYFSGKEEIVEAALNWSSERIMKRISDVNIDEANLDTFLPIIQSTLPFDAQADLEWRVRLALWNYACTNDSMRAAVKVLSDTSQALMHDWAALLQAKGELRQDLDLDELSHTLYCFINGLAFNLLHSPITQRHKYLGYVITYIDGLRA